ncbi:MAG: squalene/phytoene synthase family protein [Pseudomonadota bacterium]
MDDRPGRQLDELVARVDEDRWLSSRYARPADRAALIALYGLNYELARIRLAVREPGLGAIRFQWWRDGLAADGRAGTGGRHVVTEVLTPLLEAGKIPHGAVDVLIDGHQDAFEQKNRALEPEAALARFAMDIVGGDGEGPPPDVSPIARAYAAARRGEAGQASRGAEPGTGPKPRPADGPVSAGLTIPVVYRPAVAHLVLRHAYRADRTPGALEKRWRIMRAHLTGRI